MHAPHLPQTLTPSGVRRRILTIAAKEAPSYGIQSDVLILVALETLLQRSRKSVFADIGNWFADLVDEFELLEEREEEDRYEHLHQCIVPFPGTNGDPVLKG